MMPVSYNGTLQIVQGPGYVAILQEMIHDVHMIPTDDSPHVERRYASGWATRAATGRATRWWWIPRISPTRTAFRGSSENLHVVERFRRVDANTILYQFAVDDPSTWARPWSGEIPMAKIDGPIFEYACHEGNYGMANNLSGARAEEGKNTGSEMIKFIAALL